MMLKLFSPELAVLLGSLVVFAISLGHHRSRLAAKATTATSLIALLLTVVSFNWSGDLFDHALRFDPYSQLFKLFIVAGLVAVSIFGNHLKDIRYDVRSEYFLFLLLGTLGMMILVSSMELITLFIALELASSALYLLVPLRNERIDLRSHKESAAKYVMTGIVATGILLFGMSYVYGMTDSTYFGDIAPALVRHWDDPAAIVGILLVLAGLFFKLAAFPMHSWAPDVYQGAANETTAFIAGVPKAAIVAVIIRFLLCASPADKPLMTILSAVAICSMTFGNLAALVQKDIKRMLAYSSIAHAGYVLVGLATLGSVGYAAAIFYILSFVIMGLAAFLVICLVSHDGENILVDDLAGLHSRSPVAALLLGTSMFALAGIPPFAGFIGKFFILAEALRVGMTGLVVIAAINTAIGIYYYLTVVRVIYFSDAESRPAVKLGAANTALGLVLLVLIILIGVMPASLLNLAHAAIGGCAH